MAMGSAVPPDPWRVAMAPLPVSTGEFLLKYIARLGARPLNDY